MLTANHLRLLDRKRWTSASRTLTARFSHGIPPKFRSVLDSLFALRASERPRKHGPIPRPVPGPRPCGPVPSRNGMAALARESVLLSCRLEWLRNTCAKTIAPGCSTRNALLRQRLYRRRRFLLCGKRCNLRLSLNPQNRKLQHPRRISSTTSECRISRINSVGTWCRQRISGMAAAIRKVARR